MNLKEVLYSELEIKESFEIPDKLLVKLLGSDKNDFLEKIFAAYDFKEDSLRDLFQKEHSDRKNLMQDYTPDCICRILEGITGEGSVLDICSGTGALTISTIKDKKNDFLQCEELSSASIPYLLMNLCLRNISGEILQKNVVTKEIIKRYILLKGDKFSDIQESKYIEEKKEFDIIVSNPPYSLSYVPDKNDERLKGWEAPPKSKADYLFVLDALSRLKENGKAFFILPPGVLFRGSTEEKIRRKLIDDNLIEAIIGLPDKIFYNTNIPTFIMVLNKNKINTNVLFINGDKSFVKGKRKNDMASEQIQKYINVYKNNLEIKDFSKIVTYQEIKSQQYNLNISNYICIKETKKIYDPIELIFEIKKRNQEENEATDRKIDIFLEQLNNINNKKDV